MTPTLFWFAVWLLTATAVALVVGRAIAVADARELGRSDVQTVVAE